MSGLTECQLNHILEQAFPDSVISENHSVLTPEGDEVAIEFVVERDHKLLAVEFDDYGSAADRRELIESKGYDYLVLDRNTPYHIAKMILERG